VEFIQTINGVSGDIIDNWMSAYVEERSINYLTLLGVPGIDIVNKPDGKFDNSLKKTDLRDLEKTLNDFRLTVENISSPREVQFGEVSLTGGKVNKQNVKYRYSYDVFKSTMGVVESNISDLISVQSKILDTKLLSTLIAHAGLTDADVDFGASDWAVNPISVILRVAFGFRQQGMGHDPNLCILSPNRYLEFLDYLQTPQVAYQNAQPIRNTFRIIGWRLNNITVLGAFDQLTNAAGTAQDALFLDTSRRSINIITQTDDRFTSLPVRGETLGGSNVGGRIYWTNSGADPEVPDRLYTTVNNAAEIQVLNPNVIGYITTLPNYPKMVEESDNNQVESEDNKKAVKSKK
jgi:hypothetical protein